MERLSIREIGRRLTEYYSTIRTANGRVFLITTRQTFQLIFGQRDLRQVVATIASAWRTAAEQYRHNEQRPPGELALAIAALQCYVVFREDILEGSGEDQLGIVLAQVLGCDNYNAVQSHFFNPTKAQPEDRSSFQYVLWREASKHLARQEVSMTLEVLEPKAYRGRWLQFPKSQVFINRFGIYALGTELLNEERFIEDPSGEVVRRLIFNKWPTVKRYFNSQFADWASRKSRKGELEAHYCEIIARILRESPQELPERAKRIQVSRGKAYGRLCLEVIDEQATFYRHYVHDDEYKKVDGGKIKERYLAGTRLMVLAKAREAKYNIYTLVKEIAPRDSVYLAVVQRTHPCVRITDLPTVAVDKSLPGYIGVRFGSLTALQHQFPVLLKEQKRSYLQVSGGLKPPNRQLVYYEGCGPQLEERVLRKIGYGIHDGYDPDTVESGHYQGESGGFTVIPFEQDREELPIPFGFDLGRWAYTEDEHKNQLSGLSVRNPIPPATTRLWINEYLRKQRGINIEEYSPA